MTRTALFAALLLGSVSLSRADDVEVAPPPREVGPDGKAPPAPAPEAVAKAANPAETVEKIIKNSKAIADRLAESDAGEGTRKTQDQTLALIDSLLKQDNPPPKSDTQDQDKDKDKDKNPDQNPDQKKDDQDPSGGKQNKPMGGMEPKGGQQPMGGSQDRQRGERRPRSGSGQAKADQKPEPGGGQKKPGDQGPKGTAKEDKKNPMPGGAAGAKKDDPMGGTAGRTGGVPNGPPQGPSVPLADEVVKDVWGHLPDRERQQITQYYREQFMPRYSDLIKQYFSSLAEHSRRSSGEMRR